MSLALWEIFFVCDNLRIGPHLLVPPSRRQAVNVDVLVTLGATALLNSRIFEAGTGNTVKVMGLDQSFQTFDDLVVRKCERGQVQAQHTRNHLPEVHQLQ